MGMKTISSILDTIQNAYSKKMQRQRAKRSSYFKGNRQKEKYPLPLPPKKDSLRVSKYK